MKQIKRESKSLARLCGRLVRFPTENPPGICTEINSFIKDWLAESGIPSKLISKRKGDENLVSNLEKKSNPGLVLYGHADVVPAGERNRWSFPPYSGKIVDGRILGRGASDMKGGLAAALWAYKELGELDVRLRKNLQLAVIHDEENFDMKQRRLFNEMIDDGIIAGDGCIMAEPSGQDAIEVGDKGDLWLRVKATGRPAHGSSPVLGDSAILRLWDALRAIGTIWNDDVTIPGDVAEVLPFSAEIVKQAVNALGIPERYEEAKRLLTHTSVNVGTIHGGTMMNIVPDSAEAEVVLCLAPGVTAAIAMERVRQLLSQRVGIEVEKILETDPNFTSTNEPLISSLREAYRSIIGVDAKPYMFPATSDAHAFRLRGIPTALFGPGDTSVCHAYDEYVAVKDLTTFAKVYFRTAVEFCV